MRLFSDFHIFERPPKSGFAIVRWLAWRFLIVGALVMCFLAYFYATHIIGGEPLYFVNEDRYMTRSETIEVFWHFFKVSSSFFLSALLGVLFVPKR